MKRALYFANGPDDENGIDALLNARGYEIRRNEEGEEDIDGSDAARADIAIIALDAQEPAWNPFNLVQRLRRASPDLPVLFMLGDRNGCSRPALEKQGGVFCVTEPVDLSLLCRFLDFVTEQRRRQRAQAN